MGTGRRGVYYMKEQCPQCGNWVEGKLKASFTRKIATGIVKKGGFKAVGAAIGSIIPGAGTITGFGIGVALDAVAGDTVNKYVNEAADEIFDNQEYEFTCPGCGYKWTNNDNYQYSISTNDSTSGSTFDIIKSIIIDKLGVKAYEVIPYAKLKSDLDADELDIVELVIEIETAFNITISDEYWDKFETVNDIVGFVESLIGTNHSDEEDNSSKEQALFEQWWNYYLKNESDIIGTPEKLYSFINELRESINQVENTIIQSQLYYILSLACLFYTKENDDDKQFVIIGDDAIQRAVVFINDDDEYLLIQLIYKTLRLKHNSNNIVAKQNELSNVTPDIQNMTNSYLKPEYWKNVYEDIRHDSLLETCIALEGKEDYKTAIDVWLMMAESSNQFSKKVSNYYLYTYYYLGKNGVEEDEDKAFYYAKNVCDLFKLTESYNDDDVWHNRWRECLSVVGETYLYGINDTDKGKDYRLAFEYLLKASDFGDAPAMSDLALMYEEGKGVKKDLDMALYWYEKSADKGWEDAIAKVKQLKYRSDSSIEEIIRFEKLSPNEQEYLEEVKMCLEEDNEISPRERRLLDRLRTKLNISEERAKELEESLKTPQLTEEEQEYLEEYKLCLEENGEVSSKERRLLDRLRDKLGISVERAKELENNYK